MSAFIVSTACINSIVTYLRHHNELFGWLERELGFDVTTANGLSRLAEALYVLNRTAVDHRYGKGTAANDESKARAFVYRCVIRGDIAVYKAARCLLYQCSEGDVPEQSLFKALESIISSIANEIIQAMPEYEQAPWGD